MTTRKANSAIMDGIAGELAGAFDNTSSINCQRSGLRKSPERTNRGPVFRRPTTQRHRKPANSTTRAMRFHAMNSPFCRIQCKHWQNGFLDRMEEAEDGPGSEEEDAARDEQPANEANPP